MTAEVMLKTQTMRAPQQRDAAKPPISAADVLAQILRRSSTNPNTGGSAMPHIPSLHRYTPFAAPLPEARPTVLIVPGLEGSGPDHWQSFWERDREDCRRADLGDWHDPTPARWTARMENAVRGIAGPIVIAAHSLGCIATALWAAGRPAGDQIAGALLVAPCDPEAADACARLRRFAPTSRERLPFPATVVASTDDPYATIGRVREMAGFWGADVIDAGALGHINARSNLGAWPEGQRLLDRYLKH